MSDFIVIGGGIAGLSAGGRLAKHGKVTVLEAEEALGYHASGRSAALYEVDHSSPSTAALSAASGAFYHDGGYLTPRGMMLVAGPDERETFETEAPQFDVTPITMDEALAKVPILNPDTVGFAAYNDNAHDIDTDRVLQDFARTIRAAGGEVRTRARVTAIHRTATGWEVTAGGQTHSAPILLNAAGPWADAVAHMAGVAPLHIRPLRRSMARIPAPGGHDVSGWPIVFCVQERWYARPDAGKLIVSPSEEDPQDPHDAWPDDMVLAEGLARYEAMVTEPVTRLDSSWAGLRSFSPDRALVLGPDPTAHAFVWSVGQGGYGFLTAPAASQLVADLVTGAPSELDAAAIAALRPDRFR